MNDILWRNVEIYPYYPSLSDNLKHCWKTAIIINIQIPWLFRPFTNFPLQSQNSGEELYKLSAYFVKECHLHVVIDNLEERKKMFKPITKFMELA